MKPIQFTGSSLDDLRAFPDDAKREAGYQLGKVQHGYEPSDWKPMKTVGDGAKEIRIRDEAGTFRVIYLAKLEEPCTCCIVSRKRLSRPARKTSPWPESDSRN